MRRIIVCMILCLILSGCTQTIKKYEIPESARLISENENGETYIIDGDYYYVLFDQIIIRSDAKYPLHLSEPRSTKQYSLDGKSVESYLGIVSFYVGYYPNGCANGGCEVSVRRYDVINMDEIGEGFKYMVNMKEVLTYKNIKVFMFNEETDLTKNQLEEIEQLLEEQVEFMILEK